MGRAAGTWWPFVVRRERSVGSGITERTISTPLLNSMNAAEMRAFFDGINDMLTRTWGSKQELIQSIRAEFERVKALQPDIHDDLAAYNEFYKERETEAWYLKTIVMHANIVEMAIKEARPWQAVAESMTIGELLAELTIKLQWEPY